MSRHTILCVDDEPNVVRALRRLLRREPYEVLLAESAEEAAAQLTREPVDLIVCDQRMPGMTGVEFLREVKEQRPGVVRILLTGYADVDAMAAAVNEAEVYRFVFKPWDDDELKATIAQAVEHRKQLAAAQAELRRLREENTALRKRLESQCGERLSEAPAQ